MAKVTGDVSVVGLANLFQVLRENNHLGYLTIRAGTRRKLFQLKADGIRLLQGASRENPVGRILIRSTRAARQRVRGLMAAQKFTRHSLGDLAVRQGLLTPDQVDAALREQVAEEIYELFGWNPSSFEFADEKDAPSNRAAGPLARVVLNVDLTPILLEATRRSDDMARIVTVIPDRDRVPQRLRNPSLAGYRDGNGDSVREIFSLVDGARTVAEIIELSMHPEFTVLRTLYELALAGVLRIRGRGELALGDSWSPWRSLSEAM